MTIFSKIKILGLFLKDCAMLVVSGDSETNC
jgi:hypothetical protein